MNTILRILVVEDSEDDTLLILHQIKKGGYDFYYERVDTAEKMIAALREKTWDIILSDYAMPHFNGLEALKILKETGIDLPFIIISGTIGEEIAVNAMKEGAHDYLMKGNLKRLLPAIERELRESLSRDERRLFEQKKIEAEKALKESEKRYRRITEGLTDYLYSVRIENGRAVETIQGDACEVVTGYKKEEFASDPYLWFRMIVPEDRDLVKEQIRLILSGNDVPPLEHRIRCKNGTLKWVCDTTILIKDTKGKLLSYDGVIKDITSRKFAENELRKLSRAVEQSPVSVVITDIDGKIEYVNSKFAQTTGYSRDEIIGQNPRILKSGEMPAENYKKLWHTITSGAEWYGEFHNKKKNGELYWELASISPIVNSAGKITHFLAVKEDITDRKHYENALLESERKYRIVADNTYNWEFWIDDSGKFIYCSPSCNRVTGYSAREFIINSNLKVNIVHPDYKRMFSDHLVDISKKHDDACIQFVIIHKDGTERWIEHRCHPVFAEDGTYMGRRGSNSDITERKETDRKLLNAIIETEEKERNRFAQDLHDGLGPMLSTVKLYFQWLAETTDIIRQENIVKTGIQNIDDAIQAVREISNKLSPRVLSSMGLVPALKNHIQRINETQKIKIDITYDKELRYNAQLEVTAYRIFSELINNTIKYAMAHNIAINIAHNDKKNLLKLTYEDDGKGFKLKEVLRNRQGLGLHNLMQRVETLKGFVNFDTDEGKSLKVKIQLPINSDR
jgi:PAS domain S-box-containing protein